jgi:hypothetical protein
VYDSSLEIQDFNLGVGGAFFPIDNGVQILMSPITSVSLTNPELLSKFIDVF